MYEGDNKSGMSLSGGKSRNKSYNNGRRGLKYG
jgi:hypothetical protein